MFVVAHQIVPDPKIRLVWRLYKVNGKKDTIPQTSPVLVN